MRTYSVFQFTLVAFLMFPSLSSSSPIREYAPVANIKKWREGRSRVRNGVELGQKEERREEEEKKTGDTPSEQEMMKSRATELCR